MYCIIVILATKIYNQVWYKFENQTTNIAEPVIEKMEENDGIYQNPLKDASNRPIQIENNQNKIHNQNKS